MEKAGSNPALDTRTGMRPREGLHAARRSFASARSEAVLLSLTPISPVPQRAQRLPTRKHRQGGGEDVCYFLAKALRLRAGSSPARRKAVRPQGQQQHRSFPAIPITVRGEDRCYFD